MSVKEVPTIMKKIAWSMARAKSEDIKWLNHLKEKVTKYNKIGTKDSNKLQILYRDGREDNLKVTYNNNVDITPESNTVIKSKKRHRKFNPDKLPDSVGIIN